MSRCPETSYIMDVKKNFYASTGRLKAIHENCKHFDLTITQGGIIIIGVVYVF